MRDFLARASVAVAGSCDAGRVPRVHFLSGWFVDRDGGSIVCLVPTSFCEGLPELVRRAGRIAMTAEVIGPHECYQFKGSVVDSRPADDADRPVFEACRQRFVDAVHRLMPGRFTDAALRSRFREAAIAVRFEVHEIFVQTPGPAAGRRLFPAEE